MRAAVAGTALGLTLTLCPATPAHAFEPICHGVDKSWRIQEAGLDINTARVDVIGTVCTGTDGLFDPTASHVTISIRTSKAAQFIGGFDYRMRGQRLASVSKTELRWRGYVAYNACWAKYAPLCGRGDPRFSFPVIAHITFLTYDGVHRGKITNNEYSQARWS